MTLAGLRPGEKLFEEKLMAEEGLKKTKNKLIHIGCPIPFNTEQFLQQLTVLMKAAYDNDQNIREMVELIVPTYHPAGKNGSENREEEIEFSEPYRFCIFSRVMKEKGIEDAIDAIQSINEDAGRVICSLDIYGRIDDGYAERFEEVLKNVTEAIQYKGMVPYDKSVEAIKDYYALLFPTYWDSDIADYFGVATIDEGGV